MSYLAGITWKDKVSVFVHYEEIDQRQERPGEALEVNKATTEASRLLLMFPRVTGNHAPSPDREPGGIDEAQGQVAHS